jgi:hypothetical protein
MVAKQARQFSHATASVSAFKKQPISKEMNGG